MRAWRDASVVAIGLFVLYAWSAPRTIALEDDGLFVSTAYVLGIPQPPGYPVLALIGKLFTFLPFGSVAYRVHLVSALFGALTCGALVLVLRALGHNRVLSCAGGLLFGVSATFWSQSIIAEVYTLNSFLFFAMLYVALTFDGARRDGLILGAIAGLGLANHWPLFVLSAPAVLLVLGSKWRTLLPRLPLAIAVCLVTAALPYAWMILRSQDDPVVALSAPPNSFDDVVGFLLRRDYQRIDVSETVTTDDKLGYQAFLARELVRQITPLGAALAGLGVWAAFVRLPRLTWLAVVWTLLATSFVLGALLGFDYTFLMRSVIQVYPLIAYGGLVILVVEGASSLLRRLRRGASAATWATVVLVGLVGLSNAKTNVRRDYTSADRFGTMLLNALEPNAILVTHGDVDAFPVTYLHFVEGLRPDVTLYNDQGLLFRDRRFLPGDAASIKAMIQETSRPVYLVESRDYGFATEDLGVVFKIRKDLPPGDMTFLLHEDLRALLTDLEQEEPTDAWTLILRDMLRAKAMRVLARFKYQDPKIFAEAGLEGLFTTLAKTRSGLAALLLSRTTQRQEEPTVLLRYADQLEALLDERADKVDRVLPDFARGIALLRLDRPDEAVTAFERSIAAYPHRKNPAVMELLRHFHARGDRERFFDLGNRYYLNKDVDADVQAQLRALGAKFLK